jgi:hypothetical protein
MAQAPVADEKAAVVAAVQGTFDAMAAHDGAAIRALMLESAQISSVRGDGTVSSMTVEQFATRIGASKDGILERMWKPVVLVSGRLATVWVEYDFHRGGKFSHCGVDAVHLLKTAAGWRLASIAYTMETSGCEPSPLGPVAK